MRHVRSVPLSMAAFVAAIALLALFGLLVHAQSVTAGIPAEEPAARPAAAAALPADLLLPNATAAEPAALARPALAPTAHPILSDLPVRRAIAYCTDKDALIAAAYPALTPAERAALVMDSPILPTSWAYSPPATTYPYNPATGRGLLDAAGWTLAPGVEYRTKGGKELYLTLTSTDAAFRQTFLAVFEEQMRNCGVHVIRYHRNATWVFGVGGLQGRNFEMADFAWFGEAAPDLLGLYGCDRVPSPANNWSGQNYMGWCNPAADTAATQANNAALTQAERKEAYATFTNLFAAELPSLILFRRDGSDIWEHIDFNLETYAQEAALGPAGTGAAPLGYKDHNDLDTTVAAPPGAVAELIDLRYTPLVEGGNPPPGGQTTVSAFRLERVQGGVPAERYDLAGPVTLTVTYPDPALRDDYVEDTLALYVWDGAAGDWQPAEETCPPAQQHAALDTAQRTVTARVCHFSEFALLAEARPDPILGVNYGNDWVEGDYPPGHTVWVTVTNGSGAVKATAEMTTDVIPWWDGNTGFATHLGNPWQPERPDIQPGDRVLAALDNGKSATVRVGVITGAVDLDADSIAGTVDAAWLLPGPVDVECHAWGAPSGAPNKQDSVTPDGSDPYACAWDPATEWDVQRGQDLAVSYQEPAGHRVYNVFRGYSDELIFSINHSHDWVLGEYAPGHTVWITLTNSSGQVKATAELTTMENVPNWGGTGFATFSGDLWQPQQPDLEPGDWVYGAVDNGRTASAQIGLITGEVDADADSVTGAVDVAWLMPGPLDVFCRGWGAPAGAPEKQDSVTPDGSDPYTCTWDPNTEWDVEPGQDLAVIYYEPAGHEIIAVFQASELILDVNYGHDWVEGNYPPGHTIWLTVTNSSGDVKATAQMNTGVIPWWNGGTGFSTNVGDPWQPERPDIQPGDRVLAELDNGKSATVRVGAITGVVDLDADSIAGTVDASWLLPGPVDVECHPWDAPGGAPGRSDAVTPDGSDPYACAWDPATEWDVQRGQNLAVSYREPAGHRVYNVFRGYNNELVLGINYDHDWIEGEYVAGHTVWLTLTNSSGATKATAQFTTGVVPWWGETTGFSTNVGDPWQPQRPDIQPGDWVYGSVDNGYSAAVQIGQITGDVDVDADSVSGTVAAAWLLPGPVDIECRTWGAPGGAPNKQDTVIPDGADTYTCAWDPNSEWDVAPGQNIAVVYWEPAGHQIYGVFHAPAPQLHVEKWLERGEVGEGGNAVFTVQYRNEGDADAENVVITDTLQGLAYLGDTAGFPDTGGGGQVAWNLGTVAPGDWVQFSVFAQVTAAAGERVTNTVEIATSNPYDRGQDWQRRHEWSGDVVPGDTRLNIGKWAWTGDPAASYDVVFHVNPCNNGGTGSTQVTITDTLPVTLTLHSWWSDSPGWVEVSRSAHELVVSRPTLGGWHCEAVYVRATVAAAAQPGDPLWNTAVVHAANDTTQDNNEATWQGNVGEPRTNLRVDKGWGHGQLVPGGDLHYWINYRNDGNLPVGTFRITETLPVSTTFDSAWRHDAAGRHPLPPVLIGDGIVVWEIAGLDNGYGENFEVVLLADADAAPGTLLVNTAEITPLPGEDSYDDNLSTVTETLFDHGPNLRVRKQGQWDDWGQDTRRASYDIRVENVGDEIVYGVTVTDTYPAGMALDGGLNVNFWRNWTWQDHGDHFTVTLELLEPGWNLGINFGLAAANAPLPFGRVYTNTVQVTQVPNDTNPADNTGYATLTTGPDLWVEKVLEDGDFLPGELVTFILRFRNRLENYVGYWGLRGTAWLTDTLPAGMSYVSAHFHWCGQDEPEWCPQDPTITGQDLVWQLWPLGSGHGNEIRLVVRIADTVTGQETLTNWVRIASDQPAVDLEADTANNRSSYSGMIQLPHFAISKAYESSRIAGLPITYTLTITNVGQAPATGVVITDRVPANVTYVSGGSFAAGTVTWNVANLPAGGSAQVQFVGTLGHSGQVVNDRYRVAGCDQGVIGPWGAAVAFAIVPPTLTASFTQSAASVTVGDEVSFTDTSTTNGAAIVAWAWNFGDGQTSTVQHPKYTYTKTGAYAVSLKVTDAVGHTATFSLPNAVTVKPHTLYLPLINR